MNKIIIFSLILSYVFGIRNLCQTGTVNFTAGESQSFKNPMFFTVSGKCNVTDGGGQATVKMTKGTLTINGQKISAGQSYTATISAGQQYTGSCTGGCEGVGTALTTGSVTGTCCVNLDENMPENLCQTGTVNFTAGESQSFKNPMFFTVSGKCNVTDGGGQATVKMTKGTLTINGQKISAGQSYTATISAGQQYTGSCTGGCSGVGTALTSGSVTGTCCVNLNDIFQNLCETGVESFTAGQSQSFKNPFFWSVTGKCTINSGSGSGTVTMTKGTLTINGQKISQGQSYNLTVSAGQTITGACTGGCEGQGTALTSGTINATCCVNVAGEIIEAEK